MQNYIFFWFLPNLSCFIHDWGIVFSLILESLNPILNKSTAHKKPELSPKGSPGNRKSDPALVIEPQRSMYKGTESEEESMLKIRYSNMIK